MAAAKPNMTHIITISIQNLLGDLYFSTIALRAEFYLFSSALVISTSASNLLIYSIV